MSRLNLVASKSDREVVMAKPSADLVAILKKFGTVADYMTEPMVAEFYGVDGATINHYGTRNKEELEKYGYKILKGAELKAFRGSSQVGSSLNISKFASQVRLYPIKAVIVIGMMLTESEVAEQLRSDIMNILFGEDKQVNELSLTDMATNMNALFDYKAEQFTQKLMTQCKLQMSQMEHMIEMTIPKVIENIVDPMYKENHSLIEQNKELKKSASLVCLLEEFDKHKYLGGKYKECCKITPIAYIYGFEPKTFNQLLRKLHILKGKPGDWELDDGLEVRTHAHKAIYQEKTYLVWTKTGIIEIYLTLAKAGIYPKK